MSKKCGNLVTKFTKMTLAKNERCCHGPWQKIDVLVKYSPVVRLQQNWKFDNSYVVLEALVDKVRGTSLTKGKLCF